MITLDYKKIDELYEKYKGYLTFPNNETMSSDQIQQLIQWKSYCNLLAEILGNTNFRSDLDTFHKDKINLLLGYISKWAERDGSWIMTERQVNIFMEILQLEYKDKGKLNDFRGRE